MRLSDDFIMRVKDANDIYEVVSSYVPLKRSGSDYVCNCPFHSEKTPSCHIYMSTQSFYCFGCSAAGDVINFVRMYENLDYIESVKLLAQRAGIPMPDDGGDEGARWRTRILEMNREAGRFFHQTLFSPEGAEGLNYLKNKRGLNDHTIKVYGLGYAPESWGTLKTHMNSRGFGDDELERASLLSKSQNGKSCYDYFRYRVMFPFFDVRGNIVGFGGRVIGGDDPRKYLNTKLTPVYNKSSFLYSLNQAKNAKQSKIILCEGNLDVITLFQAGFKNAVATCGTAITDSHARAIANLGFKEVLICYDSDEAGQKATAKAMGILSAAGLPTRVIKMSGAKDSDEFINKFGKEAFALLIDNAESGMDYELERIKAGIDLNSVQGRAQFLQSAVNFIAGVSSGTQRAVYISAVAKDAGISIKNVEAAVNEETARRIRRNARDEQRQLVSGRPKRDKINPDAAKYPVEVIAERGILAFLIHSPDYLGRICEKISPEDFPTEFNRRLYLEIVSAIGSGQEVNVSTLGKDHSSEEISAIYKLIKDNNELPYSQDRLNDYIRTLTDLSEKRKRKSAGMMDNDELLKLTEQLRSLKT